MNFDLVAAILEEFIRIGIALVLYCIAGMPEEETVDTFRDQKYFPNAEDFLIFHLLMANLVCVFRRPPLIIISGIFARRMSCKNEEGIADALS